MTGPISAGGNVNVATNQTIHNTESGAAPSTAAPGGVLSGGAQPITLPDRLPPVSLAVGAVAEAARHPGTLTLTLAAEGRSYRLTIHETGESAVLAITPQKLADLNARARVELLAVVHDQELGVASYTRGVTIPQEQAARSLARLAILGADLWRNLFAGPGASRDSVALGERIRERSRSADLTITISGEIGGFPWHLLYDRDPAQEVITEGFWGLRHVLALQPARARATMALGDTRLGRGGPLTALAGYNRSLDAAAGRAVTAEQATALANLGLFTREVPDEAALRSAFAAGSDVDLVYLYCHVVNAQPGQQLVGAEGMLPPGVGATRIILTEGTHALTLDALSRAAPLDGTPRLRAGPLVLLNACGSAALSPLSYDGLAPYLLDLGARAVVGTETDTPVVFGAAFGPQLLNALIRQGQPLGAALRATRRHFAAEPYFNHLGLLYTLYGTADLAVAPSAAVLTQPGGV
ncbi:MAG: CHAT domain-containing protein [Oscillochloris sp.]|nr:CHAT domain-containing protein [Oscillochloris sp.]